MFCRNKHPDKIESMASILILGGVLPLAGAIIAQYGFHFRPCHFCLLERYPYLVVIAAGAASLLLQRGGLPWRFAVAIGIYALIITATLGAIHTGIEDKILSYVGGCVAQAPADGSLEALRAAIASAPLVSCDQATIVVLGISMATWNVVWAAFVILLIALQYRFERRRYDARIAF